MGGAADDLDGLDPTSTNYKFRVMGGSLETTGMTMHGTPCSAAVQLNPSTLAGMAMVFLQRALVRHVPPMQALVRRDQGLPPLMSGMTLKSC
jgi:hypothetical protein